MVVEISVCRIRLNKLQCDVPTWTIQNMLENIRDQHGSEIEYIMVRYLVIA